MPDEWRMDFSQEKSAVLSAWRNYLKRAAWQDRCSATVAFFSAKTMLGGRGSRRVMGSDVKNSEVAIGILAKPRPADIRKDVQNYEEG